MSKIKRLFNHVEIEEECIHQIISTFGGSVESLELLTEGLSTTNYKIVLLDQRKILLKIYPKNKNNEIESIIMNRLRKTIQIPMIYSFDKSHSIIPYDYMLMAYIEGKTLIQHVRDEKQFDMKMAFALGETLSKIHQTKFKTVGLLDENLKITKPLLPISKLFHHYAKLAAGTHLKQENLKVIKNFNMIYREILEDVDKHIVLTHGDFNPSNILVDEYNDLWFIDFEYFVSASIYLDIGKLFRKRYEFSKYLDDQTLSEFKKGYDDHAIEELPDDWFLKGRMTDLTSLLGLINRSDTNQSWIEYIDRIIEAF